MKRRYLLAFLAAAWPLAGGAQQRSRTPRIGILGLVFTAGSAAFGRLLSPALARLGWRDGDNIVLDWRSAEGDRARLAIIAAELAVDADVIVARTNPEILAARHATASVPIVMYAAVDPVGIGVVTSLARPGGNVTGSTWYPPETAGKLIAILKEAVPRMRRAAYLVAPDFPGVAIYLRAMEAAAAASGIGLDVVEVPPGDATAALEELRRVRADALIVTATAARDAILDFATQNGLPAIYSNRNWVEAGGLIGYLPSEAEGAERTARYIDRILRGASPADLPVEQPTRFDFLINLGTARRIGVEIPPSLLARASEVIE